MHLSELTRRLCTRDLYSFAMQHRKKLAWIASHPVNYDEDVVSNKTIKALLAYIDKFKVCPNGINALAQFVVSNPDKDALFEQSATLICSELKELETFEPENTEVTSIDMLVLLEDVFARTRAHWHADGLQFAAMLSMGAAEHPKTKEKGPNVAVQWLRERWTKDFQDEAPALAGMLHENTAAVREGLAERLRDESTNGRFPLGYPHLDDCVIVGRQNLRYIGIVGMSGDGKTTLTNSIVYNWIRQGAHVLYVTTEHTPQEIWETMAFLHQSHPDYDFVLPSLQQWEHRQVSGDDLTHIAQILRDIKERRNLPGLLEVQTFRDWETIKGHLQTNQKRNRYDILVVDYLARLDVPGDARFRDQQIKAIVHDAQKLTREYDECRGLILLTPIQVNREAHKAALKAEEGESRYNINAISSISEYQHDMDLILSVWSSDDMKEGGELEVQCLKKRKGQQPRTQTLVIDRFSGLIGYKVDPVWQKKSERTLEDVMHEEQNLSNYWEDVG